MPRIARVLAPGVPHHVTQRGNGRQPVFLSDHDYSTYLGLLQHYAGRSDVRVWAYCLMPNHVHLIAVPGSPRSLPQAMGRLHADYARHFNIARLSCGHVWQARYFSCPLARAHLWHAMAYVERNPVRAGLAAHAAEYRWSSAAAHLRGYDPGGLVDLSRWAAEYDPARWRTVLESSIVEEALAERLRQATVSGRPFGSEDFVAELEEGSGRTLRPRKPGRPKKAATVEIGN
jgi:putative transposase